MHIGEKAYYSTDAMRQMQLTQRTSLYSLEFYGTLLSYSNLLDIFH